MIDFDMYQDVKRIVYETIVELAEDEINDHILCLDLSEEITERVLDYLRACEGIPV